LEPKKEPEKELKKEPEKELKKEPEKELKKEPKGRAKEEPKDKMDLMKSVYLKLHDPEFLFKAGVSVSCVLAIISLIVSDFGMLKDSSAGVCCYSNCYCYSCCYSAW